MDFDIHLVQVCRYGRSRQLEHLLFYGADVNAVNKNGNTALHVCALNGQVGLFQKGPICCLWQPVPCKASNVM